MTKATVMMLQIERHQGKGKVKGHEGNCLRDFSQIRALYSLGMADDAVRKCH